MINSELDRLIGTRIVQVDDTEHSIPSDYGSSGYERWMHLSDGTVLGVETGADDCCSYLDLKELVTTDHIITSWREESHYPSPDWAGASEASGPYTSQIIVVTEDGQTSAIARADGDASNGYYLTGWALDVRVVKEPSS